MARHVLIAAAAFMAISFVIGDLDKRLPSYPAIIFTGNVNNDFISSRLTYKKVSFYLILFSEYRA
jgi:hypothetical protein